MHLFSTAARGGLRAIGIARAKIGIWPAATGIGGGGISAWAVRISVGATATAMFVRGTGIGGAGFVVATAEIAMAGRETAFAEPRGHGPARDWQPEKRGAVITQPDSMS